MVTADADGDVILLNSTTATLEPALTTANAGGVSYRVDAPLSIVGGNVGDGTIYLHIKTDSGTLTLDGSAVYWSE